MSTPLGPIAAQRERNARLLARAEQLAAAAELAGDARRLPVSWPSGPSDAENRSRSRSLPVILLPANTRNTVPLPVESREAFLAGLHTKLAVVFDAPATDDAAEPGAAELAAMEDATDTGATPLGSILGAACGTCGGECCTAGGTHAFLRPGSLERVRAQREAAGEVDTAEGIEAAYAAYLPARHYRGSCVFHTADACALPRAMRSNLCNRYLCGGLTQLSRALASTGSDSAYVAAADSVNLRRLSRLSPAGTERVSLRAAH